MNGSRSAPAGIRLGVARGIQYGLIAEPDMFAARAEQLGARLLRVFVYWSQLEPEPGRYDWSAVDAILEQVDDDTELWFMIGSSSPWAGERSTDFLPASPPLDTGAYACMISSVVAHCGGRVRWWQCENEPCNPLFWFGSAAQYVEQLGVFSDAVKGADPTAEVVLGGCPPGVFPAGGPDGAERAFFDHLLDRAHGAFDVFDIHLYGDPYTIPSTIADIRQAMRSRGYEKPVMAGEYNGPLVVQYREALEALTDVLRSGATNPWHRLTAREFLVGELSAPSARDAMKRLYERMAQLPTSLQMFMTGCPAELESLRQRISARDIVIRNVLALSCGLQRTVCWQIHPDIAEPPDPYEFLRLMFAKFNLLPYDPGEDWAPCADAFAELAGRVNGATVVRRLDVPQPDVCLFEIVRVGQSSCRVAWLRHDGVGSTPEPQWIERYGLTVGATPTFAEVASAVPPTS